MEVEIDYCHESKRGVIKTDTDTLKMIRGKFSCTNKARQMADPEKRRFIPKRNYMITKTGKFPIGMMNEIFQFCLKKDKEILKEKRFKLTDTANYFYEPRFNVPDNFTLPTFTNFRDIQIDSFSRIFKRGRGVVNVGTGGGKSYIIIGACEIIQRYNPSSTILIYVPSHLCTQLYKDFIEQGFTENDQISVWSSEHPDTNFNAPILIASMSMCIHKNNKETFDTHCKNRNVCLIDECHRITVGAKKSEPNATAMKVLEMNTNNIIGFTGTVPIDPEPRWCCLGIIGKVIHVVESKTLKDKGHKAESKIIAMKLNGSKFKKTYTYDKKGVREELSFTDIYNQQKDYIVNSEGVNKFIRDWIMRACKRNTLVPVTWDDQEELIYDYLKDCGRKVVRINGQTPKSEREEILANLEKEEDTIVIFKTKTLAEGVSVNNIHHVVGYYLQKAYTTIIQIIGRAERIKDDDSIATIFDFYVDMKKSEDHFSKRVEFYEKEKIPVKYVEKTIVF